MTVRIQRAVLQDNLTSENFCRYAIRREGNFPKGSIKCDSFAKWRFIDIENHSLTKLV